MDKLVKSVTLLGVAIYSFSRDVREISLTKDEDFMVKPMTDKNKNEENQHTREERSIVSDEGDTPIEPSARQTGQGERVSDVREGAQPEAPGNKNIDTPGNPNQGTEAR